VTQALEGYLDREFRGAGEKRPVVYTCGPEPMMKRVAEIAGVRGIECQVAVERAMACGMGTCQSCCIRLRRDPKRDGQAFLGKDWIYKLACTDGPVFLGKDLLW
jgi:dihydroorotate dehydrogenase electron transfer subunit